MLKRQRLFLFCVLATLAGCISPWAVMPGGKQSWEGAVLPPGTEIIEVAVEGDTLKGVYVPGEPGAPLVLHLLEAMGSATLGCLPEVLDSSSCGHPVLWQLQGLGYASMMLDYRGVGTSSGSRHIRHLIPDSVAMWEAAMARVDQNPQRIILRTSSLGTIGACHLIQEGNRPSCWISIAPIDPRTVADNVLYGNLWSPIAWLATVLATNVADIDPCPALGVADIPKLCFLPEGGDQFVTTAELLRIRIAVEAGGGTCATLNENHIDCAGAGHWLRPLERQLLRELHGSLAPTVERERRMAAAGGRLDARAAVRLRLLASVCECDPELALAAAGCGLPPSAMLRWVPWLERLRVVAGWRYSREQWLDVLTLRDAIGPLCSDAVVSASSWLLGIGVQRRGLQTGVLASLLGMGSLQEIRTLIYDGRTVPDITLNMLLGLLAGAAAPGSEEGDWRRRLRLLVRKAMAQPGEEPPAAGEPSWDIRSPNQIRRSVSSLVARSEEPNPLLGLDPELLTSVLAADLPDNAPHLATFVREHAADVSHLLASHPRYCDMATFAASWWHSAGAVYDFGIPDSWVKEHCDRVQAMPHDVQLVLCKQLQEASKVEPTAGPMAPGCLAKFHVVDVEPRTERLTASEMHALACRAIPWRRVEGSAHLQFWFSGSWVETEASCTL